MKSSVFVVQNKKKSLYNKEMNKIIPVVDQINQELITRRNKDNFYHKEIKLHSWLIANKIAQYYQEHNIETSISEIVDKNQKITYLLQIILPSQIDFT